MTLLCAILTATLAVGENHVVAPVARNTILVKLTKGTSWQSDRGVVRTSGNELDEAGVILIDWAQAGEPKPLYRIAPIHGQEADTIGLNRWWRLPIGVDDDPRIVASMLSGLGGPFEVVEADHEGGLATNDPIWSSQWSLENTGSSGGVVDADIDAPAAWLIAPSGGNVIVAVLDDGISQHVDLAGRILPGWNVPLQSTSTASLCSDHGTHVSGTIAAAGGNGLVMAGIACNARILPIVVVNPCTGSESWVAEGIVWAADNNADVINMSLQYSVGSQALHDAVYYAAALDIPMVAATGNFAMLQPSFPARWPETIAVTASDKWDGVWALSNTGIEVDLAAPGVSIDSLNTTTTWSTRSGTSMAAPHVSGTIALMLGELPILSTPQIRIALESTADDIGAVGFDNQSGHGRLNAAAAVAAAIGSGPGAADVNGDGVVNGADLALMLGSWGACSCPCPADVDENCAVDGADLALILGAWSQG